ncbi:MAG: hypothetical protein R3Y47_05455 [Lachnospiraceae bacterium]
MSTTKISWIIVGVLAVVLGVALFLNKDIVSQNKTTFENVELNIISDGEQIGTLSYDDMIALGAVEFEAVYDTSNTDAIIQMYKGVEIKTIIESFGISLEDKEAVVLTAVDNYAMAYTVEEVLEDGNVYATFECEGEALLDKDNDGDGPIMAIVTSDQFSNRRCKWMISIEVK